MNGLTYLDALLLGIVQGLTEFLPISSSGHLSIVMEVLGLRQDTPQMLAFTVVSHFATLLAIIVVFRRSLYRFLAFPAHARSLLVQAGLACAVTAAIAFPFEHTFEQMFSDLRLIAVAMSLTGMLLFVVEQLPRPRRGWRQFGWLAALAVGLAQAIAVTPGISRSGATICCAMLLGLRRRWAAEFSFLIAAPAITGVTLIKTWDLIETPLPAGAGYGFGPILFGGLVAALTGYFALNWLLDLLRRARLHWFSYYLWLLAAILFLVTL